MARVRIALVVAVVLVAATGCVGKVKISPAAIEDFRGATHLQVPKTIELSDGEVTTLARQASVSDDVIRDVAPSLDSENTWKSSITRLRELYGAVPEEVRSGTITIACDALNGEYETVDDVAQALFDEFGPVDEPQVQQIVQSFLDYYYDMAAALESGDTRAAAVVLTCFIADQAV
jgi:hypothetical protein